MAALSFSLQNLVTSTLVVLNFHFSQGEGPGLMAQKIKCLFCLPNSFWYINEYCQSELLNEKKIPGGRSWASLHILMNAATPLNFIAFISRHIDGTKIIHKSKKQMQWPICECSSLSNFNNQRRISKKTQCPLFRPVSIPHHKLNMHEVSYLCSIMYLKRIVLLGTFLINCN